MTTKGNTSLAREIIEQHGNVVLLKDQTAPSEVDKKGELVPSTKKVYGSDITILGMGFSGVGNNKSEGIDDIVGQLAAELDSGALVLSDTWAEDNLTG